MSVIKNTFCHWAWYEFRKFKSNFVGGNVDYNEFFWVKISTVVLVTDVLYKEHVMVAKAAEYCRVSFRGMLASSEFQTILIFLRVLLI